MPQIVLVDGSNLLYSGRKYLGSERLSSAMESLASKFPDAQTSLILDASTRHKASAAGDTKFDEVSRRFNATTPPAGSQGKADALICAVADERIAQGVDVVIVTGDSYKEFQRDYPWICATGGLVTFVGGSVVSGVWYWTKRRPVRQVAGGSRADVDLPSSKAAVRGAEETPSPVQDGAAQTSNPTPVTKDLSPASEETPATSGASSLAAIGSSAGIHEVFGVFDGELRHRWWKGDGWSSWHTREVPEGLVPEHVGATAHDRWSDLFVITTTGNLFHSWWGPDAGWSDWGSWGDGFTGPITLSSTGRSHSEIWVHLEGRMVHQWLNESDWSGWHDF